MAREIFENTEAGRGEYADDMHKYIIMHKTVKNCYQTNSLNILQGRREDLIL